MGTTMDRGRVVLPCSPVAGPMLGLVTAEVLCVRCLDMWKGLGTAAGCHLQDATGSFSDDAPSCTCFCQGALAGIQEHHFRLIRCW